MYLSDAINSATLTALALLVAGSTSIVSCGVDMSGVGSGDSGFFSGCVCVGDHTVIGPNHHVPANFTFTKSNDPTTTVVVTPASSAQVGTTDIRIYKFTAALPVWVKRHKLLPYNWQAKLSNDVTCLFTRQNHVLYAGAFNYAEFSMALSAGVDQDQTVPEWYFAPLISGDSGYPAGFLLGGEFVVAMHFIFAGGTGVNYLAYTAAIQATMDSLTTGDTLQFADLSGYQDMGIDINQSFSGLSDGALTGQGSWLVSDAGSTTLQVLGGKVELAVGRVNTVDGNSRTAGLAAFNPANPFTAAFQIQGVLLGAGAVTLAIAVGSDNDEMWEPVVIFNHGGNTVDVDTVYDGFSDHQITNVGPIPTSPVWVLIQFDGTHIKTFYNGAQIDSGVSGTAITTLQLGLQIFRTVGAAAAFDSISAIRFYDSTPQVAGLAGTPAATSVGLSWDFLPGAQTYKVYSSADAYAVAIATVSTNAATITGLTPKTDYHYKVTAVAGGVEGPKSLAVDVTTAGLSTPHEENWLQWLPWLP